MDDVVCKPKKARKRISQSENDASASKKAKINGFIPEEPKAEESEDITTKDEFDGRSLRSLLSSSSGLDSLRKFLTICNENKERDLAAEYLLAGGGVLEILRLLDFSDKKSIANATTVFSAINILLMKYACIHKMSFIFVNI